VDMHEKPLPGVETIEFLPEPFYGMDPDYDPPSWPVEPDPEIPF